MTKSFFARASAFALAVSGSAAAQTAEQPEDDAFVQDTITVTAQFREQSAIDVPIAITAYDGEFLNDLGVNEFDELSAFTPGFLVQEQSVNNPGFVLRGITSDDGAANIEPRVSVFQNGVSIARSRGSAIPLHDIERVEVLKGPQGTLFGRSAQIGAVHVITNKAGFDFEAGAKALFGTVGQRGGEAYVNIPLVEDVLAVRGAVFFESHDGFIDNTEERDLNSTSTFAARASLRYKPVDNISFDLIGNYIADDPTGTSFKSGVIPALGGTTDPNEFASLNTFGGFLGSEPLGIDREVYDITGIIDWRLNDAWRLVSTTAYREFESLEVFDPDGTAFDIFTFAEDARGTQTSSDLRFSYEDGGALRGFFGGGVFFEEGSQGVPLGFDIGNTVGLFGSLAAISAPVDGQAFFGGSLPLAQAYLSGDPTILDATLAAAGIPSGVFQVETFTNSADNFSFDVFGEVEFDLTNRLTVTAGGRYTRDDKETLFASEITQANPFTPFVLGTPALLVGDSGGVVSSDSDAAIDSTFDGFSWRGVVRYAVTDDANVYFNYSRGRRPEVIEDAFTTLPDGSAAPGFEIIPAELVNSYEVGAKGSFLDGRFIGDIAVYYYDYENFQTTVTVDAGPGVPPDFVLVNGGSADSVGVELGFEAQPVDELTIFGTYGYNRGRFDETDADGNPQIFGGNQFRLSPDHAFSIGMTYERPTDFGSWYFTPTYTWKSEVFFEDENQEAFDVIDPASGATVFSVPAISEEAFGLLNLRVGLNLMNDRLRLEGFVDNVLDREFIVDAGNTGGAFGIPTFIAGRPRFAGGSVTVRY
ncbi:MAG: TonB-dependent receptor [Pseudomonadota bacterium]